MVRVLRGFSICTGSDCAIGPIMSVVGLRCWPCEIVARSICRYICGLLGMTYGCDVSKITNLFPTVAVRRYSVK